MNPEQNKPVADGEETSTDYAAMLEAAQGTNDSVDNAVTAMDRLSRYDAHLAKLQHELDALPADSVDRKAAQSRLEALKHIRERKVASNPAFEQASATMAEMPSPLERADDQKAA